MRVCAGGVEHPAVVVDHSLLVLVEGPSVRRKDHERVGPGRLEGASVPGRLEAALAVHPGDEEGAVSDRLRGRCHHPLLVGKGHGRVLPGMAVEQESGETPDAGEPVEVGGEGRLVGARSSRRGQGVAA